MCLLVSTLRGSSINLDLNAALSFLWLHAFDVCRHLGLDVTSRSCSFHFENFHCIPVRDGEKYKACRDKYSPASDNMKLMSKVAARINHFPFFMLILSLILYQFLHFTFHSIFYPLLSYSSNFHFPVHRIHISSNSFQST